MSEKIRNELREIMKEYHRQIETNGYVDSPGGLEHMGDVWKLFVRWERELTLPVSGAL